MTNRGPTSNGLPRVQYSGRSAVWTNGQKVEDKSFYYNSDQDPQGNNQPIIRNNLSPDEYCVKNNLTPKEYCDTKDEYFDDVFDDIYYKNNPIF